MKISDHISVYQKNNGDELALQFINDRIYDENYYAKKAEDILNDKK